MQIIDGDARMPSDIANELGFIGGAMADTEILLEVDSVIEKNP